jgi:hypothetical protein
MKILPTASLIAASLVAAAIFASPASNARVPVLLELFTSEGCSSCPPADSLLEALDRQPVADADLIVMSEHVDYWNYLGWSDPNSSPVFSARQQKYAARLGTSVYTPQLVLDGHLQATGSDQQEVTAAIARAVRETKLPVSVRAQRTGSGGTVHVDANSSGKSADLYIAIAADHMSSHVLRGENGGKTLTHVAVAESIIRVGKWDGSGSAGRDVPLTAKQLPATAQAGETRVIAILQDPQTGRILGVAQARI